MRGFIKDYFFVLVTVFAMVVPLYYAIVPKENEYTQKYEYLTNNHDGIKILLLGHSHFYNSINPNVLGDSVFNAALSGRVIYYDIEIAKKFFPLMNNLETVIYPMHYSFENACNIYQNHSIRRHYFNSYKKNMDIPPPKDFREEQVYDELTLACFLDDFTFKSLANHKSIDSSNYYNTTLGFHPLFGTSDYNPRKTYVQIMKKEFTEQLTELARICEEYNIRLIVTTSPCSNLFLQCITEEGINNLYEVIEDVSQKHPIEYHNYLADSSFRSDSLYYDASHLNYEGATLFAKKIKEDFGL